MPPAEIAAYFIKQILQTPVCLTRQHYIHKLNQAVEELQTKGAPAAKLAKEIIQQISKQLKSASWQHAMLSLSIRPSLSTPSPDISASIDARLSPITLSTPMFCFLRGQGNVFAIMGSSFLTNRERILAERRAPDDTFGITHSMDAFHVEYLPDGIIFAFGDGCGGHREAEQDKRILLSAQTAVKQACEKGKHYDSPETFLAQANTIIGAVAATIKQVASVQPAESTTLLVCRIFRHPHGYNRVVAINIGDGMMAMYTPMLNNFKTVVPACSSKQMGTAMLPAGFKDVDILTYEFQCSPGAILLPMSDGVFDYLPQLSCMETINANKLGLSPDNFPANAQLDFAIPRQALDLTQFKLTHLNDLVISRYLHQRSRGQVESCVRALSQLSIDVLNDVRQEKLQAASEVATMLPTLRTTIEAQMMALHKQQQRNDEDWDKVKDLPEEMRDAEKIRLRAIDEDILSQRRLAKQPLEERMAQREFNIGDDFTLVGVPLY